MCKLILAQVFDNQVTITDIESNCLKLLLSDIQMSTPTQFYRTWETTYMRANIQMTHISYHHSLVSYHQYS